MAHRKSGGSSRVLRDSNPQYLGIKLSDGATAKVGAIIVRQRGTSFVAGANVSLAKDDTLFALKEGIVRYKDIRKKRFDGTTTRRKLVEVVSPSA